MLLIQNDIPPAKGGMVRMVYQWFDHSRSSQDWLRKTACAFLPILVSMWQPHSSGNSQSARPCVDVAGEGTGLLTTRRSFPRAKSIF